MNNLKATLHTNKLNAVLGTGGGAGGAQGPAGPPGPQGPEGPQGPAGPKGDTGATGPEGPQGPKGDAGAAGATGPAGAKGDTGPAGPKGDAGSAGVQGPEGPSGLPGPQGVKGDIGPQGAKGDTGFTGPQGATGPKGDAGATGAQGIKGDTGLQGQPGAQGAQGVKGDTGATGPQGASGIGIPIGGTAGQVLAKTSFDDYATSWQTITGGSGAVSSVFGRTGAVVATAGDYTAVQVNAVGLTGKQSVAGDKSFSDRIAIGTAAVPVAVVHAKTAIAEIRAETTYAMSSASARAMMTFHDTTGSAGSVGFIGTPNQLDIINTRGDVRVQTASGSFALTASGDVGIGTTAPTARLDVSGGQLRVRSSGAYVEPTTNCGSLYYDAQSGVLTIDARSAGGSTALSFRTSSAGVGAERMKVLNSGAVGINQLAGTGNRAVYSDLNGYLTNASSDATLKTNLATVTDGADIVAALRPVRFDWIDQQARGAQREIGLVAQEVATVLPEVVGTNADGTMSVDYSHIVAVLIGAVQDLQAKVAALEAKP